MDHFDIYLAYIYFSGKQSDHDSHANNIFIPPLDDDHNNKTTFFCSRQAKKKDINNVLPIHTFPSHTLICPLPFLL